METRATTWSRDVRHNRTDYFRHGRNHRRFCTQLLDDRSPTLTPASLSDDSSGEPMYLIGLIGGKDVGKSSFVNALVGQNISEQTSHGPGTEVVVAYAHEAMVKPLRELLDREVPGRFKIYAHSIPRLLRQVLLDLPDIDSIYSDHIEVTRTMLRQMLYPIWIQSIEKYADQQPQKLLGALPRGMIRPTLSSA